jgi:hypothetical protein
MECICDKEIKFVKVCEQCKKTFSRISHKTYIEILYCQAHEKIVVCEERFGYRCKECTLKYMAKNRENPYYI